MDRISKTLFFSFLIFIVFFAALFSSETASGAGTEKNEGSGNNIIGTVDMKQVYAYHPLMLYYDGNAGLFIKPVEASNLMAEAVTRAESDRNIEFQRAREANAQELRRLRNEITAVTDELQKIDHKTDMEINMKNESFKETYAAINNENEKKTRSVEHRIKIDNIKTNFLAEKKELKIKLNETTAAFENLRNSVLKFHYLSREDSEKLFERIKNESFEAVKQSAADEGISFVMESGLMSGKTIDKKTAVKKRDGLKTGSDGIEAMIWDGPSYTNILNLLTDMVKPAKAGTNTEYKNIPDNFNKISNGVALKRFQSMLSNNEYISGISDPKFQKFRNAPIIYGGRDITAKVIIGILTKYKIPKDSIGFIGESLENDL